jgi:hypothetical protein
VQQGGRVRNLGDSGHKSIYLIDPLEANAKAGPCDESGIGAWLKVRGGGLHELVVAS